MAVRSVVVTLCVSYTLGLLGFGPIQFLMESNNRKFNGRKVVKYHNPADQRPPFQFLMESMSDPFCVACEFCPSQVPISMLPDVVEAGIRNDLENLLDSKRCLEKMPIFPKK